MFPAWLSAAMKFIIVSQRGQLLVMLCLGIIYAVGLTLMGLNFGLPIGAVSAPCRTVSCRSLALLWD